MLIPVDDVSVISIGITLRPGRTRQYGVPLMFAATVADATESDPVCEEVEPRWS